MISRRRGWQTARKVEGFVIRHAQPLAALDLREQVRWQLEADPPPRPKRIRGQPHRRELFAREHDRLDADAPRGARVVVAALAVVAHELVRAVFEHVRVDQIPVEIFVYLASRIPIRRTA